MLKIYVCEDNEVSRTKMKSIIEQIKCSKDIDIEIGKITENPYELLSTIEDEKQQSLYFLDIDLSCDMNGLELAKEIRKKQPRCYIVFVTTHSEMSFMTFSYRVEAMDFILKDNPEELTTRVVQCIKQAILRSESDTTKVIKNFQVKIGDHIKNVPVDQIKYFEVSSESRKIILHGTDCIIEFNGKLKDIENTVDGRFARCHRAIIVNKDYISHIDHENHILHLTGGEACPMSVRLGRNLSSIS